MIGIESFPCLIIKLNAILGGRVYLIIQKTSLYSSIHLFMICLVYFYDSKYSYAFESFVLNKRNAFYMREILSYCG